ncbi:MAG: hypothetical protein ACTHMY_03465 [Solirubrobacteraceae bacterium]
MAPVRDSGGTLPEEYEPALEVLALPLSRLRHMADWLEGNPGAAGNFRLVREMRRLEAHIWRMLESFGMTPRSKAAMGLDVAATGALQRIEPVRSPERAQRVAQIMAASGMLPTPSPPDAEVVEGHEVDDDEPPPVRRVK